MVETHEELRAEAVKRLYQDIIGPLDSEERLQYSAEKREGDTPLTRYLTGMLFPANTPVPPEEDDAANEAASGEEDEEPPLRLPATGIPKPSSMGISFSIKDTTPQIEISCEYGVYILHTEAAAEDGGADTGESETGDGGRRKRGPRPDETWTRRPHIWLESRSLPLADSETVELAAGAQLEVSSRHEGGAVVVIIFLRNTNATEEDAPDNPARCLFQPRIRVRCVGGQGGFISRSVGQQTETDPEMLSYELLYRAQSEYAVGHNCSAVWNEDDGWVATEFMPVSTVPAIDPLEGKDPGLQMLELMNAVDGGSCASLLLPLIQRYDAWIEENRREIPALSARLQPVAEGHMAECAEASRRMREGIDLLVFEPLAFEAFRFMNQAMYQQRIQGEAAAAHREGRVPSGRQPAWRPFQLGFILLNLKSFIQPDSPDRRIVDLLWFPTGGGKTEAYLGLSAFCLGLRRLRSTSGGAASADGDGGVTIIMRYTLRLLTTQQFQRATTLICACEVIRRAAPDRFGSQPFSIGLWVGGSSTPNYIDRPGNADLGQDPGAWQVLNSFDPENEPAEGNPVQLRSCPWCGHELTHLNYIAHRELRHLQIGCPRETCPFHGTRSDPFSGLPVYVVDEDLYLRCPSMLIGTVDKFARLPWDDRVKSLFGRVNRKCPRHSYLVEGKTYEECTGRHNAAAGLPAVSGLQTVRPFLPPELIIQDELHLITGPLGSLTGLYETAVDLLCTLSGGHAPKVIASTATIRRFKEQIQSLFARPARQFPPPALDAGETFFARVNRQAGRTFVGICAPGKSMKTTAIRVVGSLLHTAWLTSTNGAPDHLVDPYWTILYYFNSIRELGGAVRLVDDDIRQRLAFLANQDRMAVPRVPERRPELTSRIPARDVPKLLKEMEQTLGSGGALDVVLATNMISVGVDIQRFGLMVVTGQPKASAEYIQATSRVGRQAPGLVSTIYNWSRPRDMSHYERFTAYHTMMYRYVEGSSVTPFSGRARDKGLHAVLVAVLRLLNPGLANNSGASAIAGADAFAQRLMQEIAGRVAQIDPPEAAASMTEMNDFVDGWKERAGLYGQNYRYRPPIFPKPEQLAKALLRDAEESDKALFPRATLNSLREVEQTSGLYFKMLSKPRGGNRT